MSAYEQRKALEKFMGKGALDRLPRDFERNRRSQPSDPKVLDNPRICKSFLVGKCPYDLFSGTKENFGRCPKIHQERYRILYESTKSKGIPMPNSDYELDYLHDLNRFIEDCNRKVRQAEQRLERAPEKEEDGEESKMTNLMKQIDEVSERITLASQEAQLLAGQSLIEKSLEVSRSLQKMVGERARLEAEYQTLLDNVNQQAQQKMTVCKDCGAYLSKLDSDQRLADHFSGKIHRAYIEMRNASKELHQTYRK